MKVLFISVGMCQLNLFELLLALAVLSFLGLQQTGQFLLLLSQDVLLELLFLRQDGFCLKPGGKEKQLGDYGAGDSTTRQDLSGLKNWQPKIKLSHSYWTVIRRQGN